MLINIKTRDELADLIGVEIDVLEWVIYSTPARKYNVFKIHQGQKERSIQAPMGATLFVQNRLRRLLDELYRPKPIAHAYIKGRSIKTNAASHQRARWIVNIDLEDFFPSIKRRRIRGILSSKYYGLEYSIADDISKIVSFGVMLPTGAPTSGVISNIICGPLDSSLIAYAKERGVIVSRYADDITFSSFRRESLAGIISEGLEKPGALDTELVEILAKNGFEINTPKTKVMRGSARRIVTGLVVNSKVNIRREFLKDTRSAIHAIEKFGWDAASEVYLKKFRKIGGDDSLLRYIRGRLAFIQSIKGYDPSFEILARRFNHVRPKGTKPINLPYHKDFEASVFVLESSSNQSARQGSCFLVSPLLLVTCSHALPQIAPVVFSPREPATKYSVWVVHRDHHRDFAVLKLSDEIPAGKPLPIAPRDTDFSLSDSVTVLGFPNYGPGKQLSMRAGRIVALRTRSCIRHIVVDALIISGNSGGPVLDRLKRVIGIAVRGAGTADAAPKTDEHLALRIGEFKAKLDALIKKYG